MTSRNRSILAWAFIVFVSGVALSCKASARPGYFEDDKKTAERAIDQFHAKYNAGQHEEVYREASEPLRGSVTEEAMVNTFIGMHEQAGKVQAVSNSRLCVLMGAPVQVKAVYNTKFDKMDATELFVWLVNGDKAKLVVYHFFAGTAPLQDDCSLPKGTRLD